MKDTKRRVLAAGVALLFFLNLAVPLTPAMAQVGATAVTPAVPMELPVEVEIELAPAASLKKAPLWKELIQLLRNPNAFSCTNPANPSTCTTTAPITRRPGFGATMPPLDIWPPNYNFLTAEPLRLRTSDGEVSWDQPGPLFDPAQDCGDVDTPALQCNEFNVPQVVRTIIGHLVACPNDPPYQTVPVPGNVCAGKPAGSLVVYNTTGSTDIPPTGTVVAVAAVVGGVLQELAGTSTTATDPIVGPLGIPINEEDFLRPTTDIAGVPNPLRPHIGRLGAEVLGKALFWDMQVGSDGVQACGSCHFHAGVDNRTKGQLNPNITANPPDFTLQVKPANTDVVAADFPFHKRIDPNVTGDGTAPGIASSDANDVMSSMGVSRFKLFVDIPPIGGVDDPATPDVVEGSFGPASAIGGVRPLARDIGTAATDPVPVNESFRRVEPRNTPTMHAAAFNLDNFWDGRARFNYNGGSVFGPSDPTAHIFIDPGTPNGPAAVNLQGATNGHIRPGLIAEADPTAGQPVRIKFSSLASQAQGPPLSDFEMSFAGRNWAKIGKKMLQGDVVNTAPGPTTVTPLANQLVSATDSRLGPFSNQGGSVCAALGRATAANKPGLCISYGDLIRLSFDRHFWHNDGRHLNGAACSDPFDGYCLTVANGAAVAGNTNQFRQIEANFSMFFGLAVQMYEQLLIPDDTPFDRFMDANPLAANGIGQPGEQAVLFPTLVPGLVGGTLTLVPGFGEEELFGFDLFAGGNLTAALPVGSPRNPAGLGSNPFTRNARCMLCHLGPEQTDHSINISHGLIKGDAEFEFPTPPSTGISYTGPGGVTGGVVIPPPTIIIPSPEPPGPFKVVGGLILAEEIAGPAQDAVEVEPRSFALVDDPLTPWDDRIVAQPRQFAFGDQGMYNVGVRPHAEDIGRGGNDPFGFPLSLSALALQNIAGVGFVPGTAMGNVDPENLEATFELTGEELPFPGTSLTLQSINPGFEKTPIDPQLPAYLALWANELPAGELHPEIDELGFAPNTLTPPLGGPALEFGEAMFGADLHCGNFDPATFGNGPPNFGWGPFPPETASVCPNNQSGVPGNYDQVLHGTWPTPNRVLRDGAFKAPQLRNVELTGPYFHTGSYLTLRQVVKFYLRGGDFPLSNAENRDPHILDVSEQAFGFGRTACAGIPLTGNDTEVQCQPTDTLYQPVDFGVLVPGSGLGGLIAPTGFADAFPDTVYRYDIMPDTDHPLTPEPATTTQEEVEVAIVKLLLSMTDARVKFERAPFDKPEMFVPVDGLAPENTVGSGTGATVPAAGTLAALSSCSVTTPCTVNVTTCDGAGSCTVTPTIFTTPLFRSIAATGAAGRPAVAVPGDPNTGPLPAFLGVTNNPAADCVTEISHFCP